MIDALLSLWERSVRGWVQCLLAGTITMAMWSCFGGTAFAMEAKWIWSPKQDRDSVPLGSCYFRKDLAIRAPERGTISVSADDTYEIYMNGRLVGNGSPQGRVIEHDVSPLLSRGHNLIAVKVTNEGGTTAAFVAEVRIKEQGRAWYSIGTDETWRTNLRPLPFWNTMLYNDSRWEAARELRDFVDPGDSRGGRESPPELADDRRIGSPAATTEGSRPEPLAPVTDVRRAEESAPSARFRISEEFRVEQLLDSERTGSLVAMTFNEFGHILASRERGPLVVIHDADRDGRLDTVRTYCDRVSNCQGILSLNGEVFVTGDGPDGHALYRLVDKDRDGTLEEVTALVRFQGPAGQHGAGGLVLGPDGMLYVVAGNQSQPEGAVDPASPYRNSCEGDLFEPRSGSPGEKPAAAKPPGCYVLRTDVDGQTIQLVAAGLRNAHDLAFSRDGELFVHDSDFDADVGAPWYRPSRLYHVPEGAEFGWRSGWAAWPEYYVDNLAGILDTGRSTPTGAVFYNHFAFPTKFHDAMFLADVSRGRILMVRLKPDGASYSASSEAFLEDSSLRVTDLDVGPDGGVYFVTDNDGSEGGLYKISWKGEIPKSVLDLGQGMSSAIRQPQLQSAWGRQKIAAVMNQLGADWDRQLAGVARSKANPFYYRVRAMHLMQLFGPPPSAELLQHLVEDDNAIVRAKAAELMGWQAEKDSFEPLIKLLGDGDGFVRRKACEAMLRNGSKVPFERLVPLLTSADRFEAWAARRLVEKQPPEQWRQQILTTDQHRLFVRGSVALLAAEGNRDCAVAVLDRFTSLMAGFVSDQDFIDMLRLCQIAFVQGQLTCENVGGLCGQLADEYPSSDKRMNRELVRLLTYLQIDSLMDRYMAFLASSASDEEKAELVLHLRYLRSGWREGQRLELIRLCEEQRKKSEKGFAAFLAQVERDLAKTLSQNEADIVLKRGEEWPTAALGVLYGLPDEPDPQVIQGLCDLDDRLADHPEPDARTLRVGIIAVLGRSRALDAMAHLRSLWDREPEQRPALAMGLAQKPDGENLGYLVRSLPILEENAAREVLTKLVSVEYRPEQAEPYRHVILLGLALRENGAEDAIALLNHWTGQALAKEGASWEESLKAWQAWYAEKYPDHLAASPPQPKSGAKWNYDHLLTHLNSEGGPRGSVDNGALVFQRLGCIKCHRFGNRGESRGPDLTNVGRHRMKKEVLQSIVFPSYIVADESATKTVLTKNGRRYSGLVTNGAENDVIVLQNNGDKVSLWKEQISEIRPAQGSAMPEGLLESLSLQEIADLLAYLGATPPHLVASPRPKDARR